MPDLPISTALALEVLAGRRHLSALQDLAETIDRKGSAQIQRFGACQYRKSRATFSGHALGPKIYPDLPRKPRIDRHPDGARGRRSRRRGVPGHHADGSALPVLVQSGNLFLEI